MRFHELDTSREIRRKIWPERFRIFKNNKDNEWYHVTDLNICKYTVHMNTLISELGNEDWEYYKQEKQMNLFEIVKIARIDQKFKREGWTETYYYLDLNRNLKKKTRHKDEETVIALANLNANDWIFYEEPTYSFFEAYRNAKIGQKIKRKGWDFSYVLKRKGGVNFSEHFQWLSENELSANDWVVE